MAVTREYDEPPELKGRNVSVAGHLLASATAFFFLAFVFAYVYLRSLNSDHLWHPKHVHAPVTLGTVFAALLVLSSVALQLVSRDERAGRFAGRAAKLGIAFALGIAALVVQVVEWASLGFGPADGGYASVFVGWTGFFFLFVILALIWIEVELAGAIRRPRDASPGVRAASFYWSFIAGIGLLTWVVLYLVAP